MSAPYYAEDSFCAILFIVFAISALPGTYACVLGEETDSVHLKLLPEMSLPDPLWELC
jgi:hypothetical protein